MNQPCLFINFIFGLVVEEYSHKSDAERVILRRRSCLLIKKGLVRTLGIMTAQARKDGKVERQEAFIEILKILAKI